MGQTWTLKRSKEAWPPLHDVIGGEVVGGGLKRDGLLVLQLQSPGWPELLKLTVPPPWVFSSCLLSVSSGEYPPGKEHSGMTELSDLIGLLGARLTGTEADNNHLDLVFGSIRLSVSAESELGDGLPR